MGGRAPDLFQCEQGDHPRREGLLLVGDERLKSLGMSLGDEATLGRQAGAVAGARQQLDQVCGARGTYVSEGCRTQAGRNQAHEVAHFRPDVRERRAFPAGDIQSALGVDIQVVDPGGAEELPLVGREGRALGREAVTVDAVTPPVAGEGRVVPLLGHAGFVDPSRTHAAASAIDVERGDRLVREVLEKRRVAVFAEGRGVVEADLPAVAVVGVIAGEDVEQRADGGFEDVARATRVDFETRAVRAHPHHAAGAQGQFASVGAFGVQHPEVTDGAIEPAVDAQFDAVGGMVDDAVLDPEADVLHEHALFVGDAVAVLVDEHAQVAGVQDIKVVAVDGDAARRVDGGEDLDFIRPAVGVEVAEAQDAATVRISAAAAVAVASDVERAIRGGADEDGVAHRRGAGEDARRESLGQGQVFEPFGIRVVLGDEGRAEGAGGGGFRFAEQFEFADAAEALRPAFLAEERDPHVAAFGLAIGGMRAGGIQLRSVRDEPPGEFIVGDFHLMAVDGGVGFP